VLDTISENPSTHQFDLRRFPATWPLLAQFDLLIHLSQLLLIERIVLSVLVKGFHRLYCTDHGIDLARLARAVPAEQLVENLKSRLAELSRF